MSRASRTIPRYLFGISIFILILAASLFFSSGSLYWMMGWVFISIYAGTNICIVFILMVFNPGLIKKRTKIKGKRDLDRLLAGIMALYGIAGICIVAGLNERYGWLPRLSTEVQIAGVVIALLGLALTVWAMASNEFFYGVLRIAQDEGHTVCTRGPYRHIRHPGYFGMIVGDLAAPLILNSIWAFIPALLTIIVIVIRLALEDKALQRGLEGYYDYVQQVRFRLVPGVW